MCGSRVASEPRGGHVEPAVLSPKLAELVEEGQRHHGEDKAAHQEISGARRLKESMLMMVYDRPLDHFVSSAAPKRPRFQMLKGQKRHLGELS